MQYTYRFLGQEVLLHRSLKFFGFFLVVHLYWSPCLPSFTYIQLPDSYSLVICGKVIHSLFVVVPVVVVVVVWSVCVWTGELKFPPQWFLPAFIEALQKQSCNSSSCVLLLL
jgi:hypothetical protein